MNENKYLTFDHLPSIEGKLDIQIFVSLNDKDKDMIFILSFHEW